MKLDHITSNKPTLKQLNKVTESRFGFQIDYDAITLPKAEAMRGKIMETVNRIRSTSAIHTAERNPKYLEMLVIYEGLSRWIDAYRTQLTEGEVGQAEVLLAAKDMTGTIQDTIEKVGKMQNEQLPALVDSIRDQIGSAQADTFKGTVGQVLANLNQQLTQAREALDGASRGLSGAEAPDMGMGAAGAAPDLGIPRVDQTSAPDDFGGEENFAADDAAAGGPESLGREMR